MVTASNCTMAAEEHSNTPISVMSYINFQLGINLYILCNHMRFSIKSYKENIIFLKLVSIYCHDILKKVKILQLKLQLKNCILPPHKQ